MENIEEKLGSILSNPQLMEQIMSMASNLSSTTQNRPESPPTSAPQIDLGMIQKLAGMAGQIGIDQNEQCLLNALIPYLSQNRINRLERAMRAAKTARIATNLLGNNGLNFLTGR